MRFTKRVYQHNETRTRSGFLWLPMQIYVVERHECVTRWLEQATWEEYYWQLYGDGFWVPTRWL